MSLTFNFGVVRCLVGFALGVGVYRIYKFLKQGRPNSVIGSDLSCGLAIAAVVAGIHGLEYEVALLPLFGWLTLAFALNAGAASRLLSHPPVHWLGRVSYSIYLVHWPIVTAIAIACAKLTPGNHAVSVGAMLFAVVATLVIAHYTYTYIEVPWRRPWSARANRQAIAAKTA